MYHDKLDGQLKHWGINHILLTGVQTEWCITQTAVDFRDKGYHVQVLQDATGSQSQGEHLSALDRLSRAEYPITGWYLNYLKNKII